LYKRKNCGAIVFISVLLLFQGSAAQSAVHHPQDFLTSIAGSADEGKQIVHHYCSNCHAEKPLIQLGAPRIGVLTDWTSRIQQGMSVLFEHTDEGINAMPARGGCFECSDKQLMLAIKAMLPVEDKGKPVGK